MDQLFQVWSLCMSTSGELVRKTSSQTNRIGPGLVNSPPGESDSWSSLRTDGPLFISKVGSF